MRWTCAASCCWHSSARKPRPIRPNARPGCIFAIVGGGPTGVELCRHLAEIARHTLQGRVPQHRSVEGARAVDRGPTTRARLVPEDLSAKARRQLEKLASRSRWHACGDINADGYMRRCIRFRQDRGLGRRYGGIAAGRAARCAAGSRRARAGAAGSQRGRPSAIFVAGDLASVAQADGKPVPASRPRPKQMGRLVAHNIPRLSGGTTRCSPTRTTATSPRSAGWRGGRSRQAEVSGLLAWWFWLAHVFFLIGFRNRVVVL